MVGGRRRKHRKHGKTSDGKPRRDLAIAGHPAVADVVVTGRPSERWGSEVVAVVQLAEGASSDQASIVDHASAHIARYKLPKAVVFVDKVERSPSGKADYRWAGEQAVKA